MNATRLHRCGRGFTLLELMVAVTIVGILAAMASPSFSAWIQRSQLDSALNRVTGDIAYARMTAVRSGQRVTVTLNETGYEMQRLNDAEPFRQVNLENDVPGLAFTSAPHALVFDSRGLMRSGATTVTAQRAGRTATLVITATGRTHRGE